MTSRLYGSDRSNLIYQSVLRDGFAVIPDIIPKDVVNHDVRLLDIYEKKFLDKSLKASFKLDSSKISKYIYHLYSSAPNLRIWRIIEGSALIADVIKLYFTDSPIQMRYEAFWRNPGGNSIAPHQDKAYYQHKQLSFIVPLSSVYPCHSALKYCKVNGKHTLAHRFSFYHMSFYCTDLSLDNNFYIPYQFGDLVIHNEFSLHKASNPPRHADRIVYARLLASEIV